MELQQSDRFIRFVEKLKWHSASLEGTWIVYRTIPFYGTLAKIHRPEKLPDPDGVRTFVQKHHIRTLAIEPDAAISQAEFSSWCASIAPYVHLNRSPFLPTKTIRVPLTESETALFQQLTEAKRRGVRRALKYGVTVCPSEDIGLLIGVKNKSAGIFGFITTYSIRELWQTFGKDQTAILLAYSDDTRRTLLGGVLLVFSGSTSYYWIAGATREGKKRFAPTLLVWEALRLSSKRKLLTFDFVGVWDERMPKENTAWLGFTKFKEGFGGSPLYYPITPKDLT